MALEDPYSLLLNVSNENEKMNSLGIINLLRTSVKSY